MKSVVHIFFEELSREMRKKKIVKMFVSVIFYSILKMRQMAIGFSPWKFNLRCTHILIKNRDLYMWFSFSFKLLVVLPPKKGEKIISWLSALLIG